jgi:hypothetical protein
MRSLKMMAPSRGMTALIIPRGMGSGPKENRCSAGAVAYIRADHGSGTTSTGNVFMPSGRAT